MEQKKRDKLSYLVKISLLAAMATVLMLLEFPLPFAPSFYKLDFSELPVLVGGFALGPMAAILIELLKILLNLVINGSDTAFVGEIGNLLIGVAFVFPTCLIYHRHRSFKGAVVGMGVGILSLTVIGGLTNYFLLIPAYSYFYGLPLEAIVQAGTTLNPSVTNLETLIFFAVVPFNLVKGFVCSLLATLLYKRVSPLLRK